MSASLVGSEMCIRDRLHIRNGWPLCERVSGHKPGKGLPGKRRDSLCAFPVSYTHLTLPTICSV
eukprot:3754002-Alexandrium_andersonii.AAC.1